MATVEIVTLSDSLDERIKSNVETVTFYHPVTGVKLEIELGEANQKHFLNHISKLDKYIDAARTVEQAPAKAVKTQAGNKSEIREWAKANGYEVGDRGRIKADIINAFYAAQSKTEAVSEPTVEVTQEKLEQALEDSAKGNVKDLGDFTQYADMPVDASDLVEVEFPQNEQDHPESVKVEGAEFVDFMKGLMGPDGKISAESFVNADKS